MNNLKAILFVFLLSSLFFSCQSEKEIFIEENTDFAVAQTLLMLENTGEPTGKNYPRTTNKEGQMTTTGMYDWTPGFFPGSLWYLYELTGDTAWLSKAEMWTHTMEPLKTYTGNHDLGFMMYCSYGNAKRLASKDGYDEILIESAKSLSTRYSDSTKSIKSWNGGKPWGDTTRWAFPVIIDNMMNLELLFYGSKVSGNSHYKDVATTHANTTLKNHFRDDMSSYHVVNYDPATGEVKGKYTAQGYSDNSTWARGQAWAIYGYTMTYRETQDKTYLDAAIKMTDWFLARLPEDLVPLWDFNVGQEGFVPGERSNAAIFKGETQTDVSAAAIVCSALFELGELANNKEYIAKAVAMLHSLGSTKYRAELGTNGDFLLKHSTGSIPHNSEIDVPLVYADYYYLEALVRYKRMK